MQLAVLATLIMQACAVSEMRLFDCKGGCRDLPLVLLFRWRRAYGWPEVPEFLNFSRSRQHLKNVGYNCLVRPDSLLQSAEKCVTCPQSLMV